MLEPTARKLLLDLVTARPRTRFTISALCRAGEIVGLSAPSVRMAAKRLNEEGVLERAGRGVYLPRPERLRTYPHVEHWTARDATRVPWTGRWAAVENSATARTDRAALRHHDRALQLLGFHAWRGALNVRPDNLRGGVAGLRETLTGTGMAPGAVVFAIDGLDPATDLELRGLWDTEALTEALGRTADELTRSRDRLHTLSPEEFARESLLLGSRAIATILHDPLLPEELCDPAPHRRLVALTKTYQDTAQEVWGRLLDLSD
jgi:phenylacetic acid degradation operon negative regulatory protein